MRLIAFSGERTKTILFGNLLLYSSVFNALVSLLQIQWKANIFLKSQKQTKNWVFISKFLPTSVVISLKMFFEINLVACLHIDLHLIVY